MYRSFVTIYQAYLGSDDISQSSAWFATTLHHGYQSLYGLQSYKVSENNTVIKYTANYTMISLGI